MKHFILRWSFGVVMVLLNVATVVFNDSTSGGTTL
jgi:hypothetical protein